MFCKAKMNHNNFEEMTIEIVTTEQEVRGATPASTRALFDSVLLSPNIATMEDINKMQLHTYLTHFRGKSIGDEVTIQGVSLVLLGIYLEPCLCHTIDAAEQFYRVYYLYCDMDDTMYNIKQLIDRTSADFEVVRENPCDYEFIRAHFAISNPVFREEPDISQQGIGEALGAISGGVGQMAELPKTIDKCASDLTNIHETVCSLADVITEQTDRVRSLASMFSAVDAEGVTYIERILSRIEDLGLVGVGIFTAGTWQSVVIMLLQYFKTFVPGSAIRLLSMKFEELRGIFSSFKMMGFCAQGEGEPGTFNLLTSIKWLNSHWQTIRNSDAARKMGDIVVVCLSFLCGGSEVEKFISTKMFEMFRLKAWDPMKGGGTLGLIDTVLSSLQFIIEKGKAVFDTGSIASIFYSESEWQSIDIEYLLLMDWAKVAVTERIAQIAEISENVFLSEDDYRYRLKVIRDKLYAYRKEEKNKINQQKIDNMILKLGTIAVSIRMLKKAASYKQSPFSVMFYGASSINKSLLMNATAKAIMEANGWPSGHDNICSPNESDKYDTEYDDEKHNTLFIDDILNTKVDWYDKPPTDRILRVKNNQPHTVLKADVDSKGAMTWQVKLMVLSTNVKDLQAHLFSNLAASIMRRLDFIVTTYLKKEYTDVNGAFTNPTDEVLPNAWYFRVEKVKLTEHSGYAFVDEYSTDNVSELLEYLAKKSISHSALQKKIVKNNSSLFDHGFCRHFKVGTSCKVCGGSEPLKDAEFGQQGTLEDIPHCTTEQYRKDVEKFSEEFRNRFGYEQSLFEMPWRDDYCRPEPNGLLKFLQSNWHIGACIGGVAVVIAGMIGIARSICACVCPWPQSVQEKIPVPIEGERENVWKARKFRSIPLVRRSQLSASTNSNDLIRLLTRDIRACRIECEGAKSLCNIVPLGGEYWLGPAHSLSCEKPFKVTLADCREGTLGIDGVSEIKERSDVVVIEGTDYAIIRLTSTPPKRGYLKYFPEGNVESNIVATCIYRPRPDYVPTPNVLRDGILVKMEEESGVHGCYTTMVNVTNVARYQVGSTSYLGYKYAFPVGTFNGLCGMALVAQARGAVILGLHLGGSEGSTPVGVAGAITIEQIEHALKSFTKPYVTMVGSGGIDDVQYGYSFDQEGLSGDKEINPKHCMNFMDSAEPCAIEVYGAHDKGTRTLRSDVRKSLISQSVEDVMGLPNKHGKPKGIGTYRPFQSNAQNMMTPCNNFDPALLAKAADDIFEHHKKALDDNHGAGAMNVHFVSTDVAVNGVPGLSGMDRIALGTSAGHPVDKPKLSLVDMEKSKVDSYGVIENIVFEDVVYERVQHLEEKALNDERLHVIFRANVKDEPTKLTKEQLRIFAGTPIDYLILCKRALSALNRVMQINWHKFECCISANCYDDDWTKLYESVMQPGCQDRFFCGDYKHWDKTLSPVLLRAGAGVIMRMCEHCGYSEDELKIVNAILIELIYPIYEWDGVYAQFLSSMPSGVFLTVMMSNICNGILFRYTFYSNAPEGEKFSDHIKCNFMGDDNLGTVGVRCTWWDQTVHAKILGDIGIAYTAADKTSSLTPFVSQKDCTYLKRKFVWDSELRQYLAPIEESSISKTLHNYMKRKRSMDTPEMISGNAIDHAVEEYFRFGKEIYEKRTAQLFEIIKRHNLYIYCHCLIHNRMPFYAEMVDKYRKDIIVKYAVREDGIRRADSLQEAMLLDFQ